MAGDKGKPKRPAPKGRSGRGKGGSGKLPVALAIALPAVLVGGFLAYHASPWFSGHVDDAASRVKGWFSSEPRVGGGGQAGDPGVVGPGPEQSGEPVFKEPVGPAMDQPLPDGPLVEPAPGTGPDPALDPSVAPAGKDGPSVPRSQESKGPSAGGQGAGASAKKVLPRQERKAVVTAEVPISARQAQKLATTLFGGKVLSATSGRGEPWYTIRLSGGKKRYPFDVTPARVLVSTTALSGPFLRNGSGFVALLRVEDPSGAEWTSCFVGATLFKGTVRAPGAVVGSTAMQAPRGRIVRQEAVDTQGDGVAELVLEIESEGPQGALFRDLGVHSFSAGGTVGRWTVRTLDDAPGLPADSAEFRNVKFKDRDGDGKLEIEVQAGRRSFKIKEDMSREVAGEKVVSRVTYRLDRGRYVVDKTKR